MGKISMNTMIQAANDDLFLSADKLEKLCLVELEVYIVKLLDSDYETDELLEPIGEAINVITESELYKESFGTFKAWLEDYAQRIGVEEQLLWNIKRVYERYLTWTLTCDEPAPLGSGLLTLENVFEGIRFANRNANVIVAYIDSLANGVVPEHSDENFEKLAEEGKALRMKSARGLKQKEDKTTVFSRKFKTVRFPNDETFEKALYFLGRAGIEMKSADYL